MHFHMHTVLYYFHSFRDTFSSLRGVSLYTLKNGLFSEVTTSRADIPSRQGRKQLGTRYKNRRTKPKWCNTLYMAASSKCNATAKQTVTLDAL
jgi:hypothetical protein